jgi:VIT1/CCC1 family predicted Fe2+/Mn2+ transporter
VVGVAVADAGRQDILLAGIAGLVAGALSMAAVCLAALGALAAGTGGASPWVGAARVAFWGALAMAATAGVGALFGTTVS